MPKKTLPAATRSGWICEQCGPMLASEGDQRERVPRQCRSRPALLLNEAHKSAVPGQMPHPRRNPHIGHIPPRPLRVGIQQHLRGTFEEVLVAVHTR